MGAGDLSASFNRLFVDISYTSTQRGSTGITRTVRSLLGAFGKAGLPCQTLAIHSRGFRETVLPPQRALESTPPANKGAVAGMLRWISGSWLRRFVLTALPVAWQQSVWRLYSKWTFDTLSQQAAPVDFTSGDILLLCDASWHYEAWDAAQRARRQGARVVLMVYDLIPLRHPEFCAPLVSRVFGRWLIETICASDAVLCISGAVEKDLHAYAEMTGFCLPPTGHFRLGCDPIRESNSRQTVRTAITEFFTASGACFSAVGSFEPRKNYAWLLQAFEKMWAKGQNVCLLIVGRPTADGQALIEEMKRHPEQGNRLLTVFDANDQELAHVYAHSRALLFPSLAEGFGLPLVEARTRGCHVIASDLPAFLELADDGVSLYPQNSFAEMEALVMAHAEVDRRGSETTMPAFTWNDSAREFLGRIDRLQKEAWKA